MAGELVILKRFTDGQGGPNPTCPICYWTDSGQPGRHADTVTDGLNADLNLADARLNFRIYGASLPRYQDLVRPPRPDERP